MARAVGTKKEDPGQRPIFPPPPEGSIVGAEAFHFRVRNGNGWFHLALVTRGMLHVMHATSRREGGTEEEQENAIGEEPRALEWGRPRPMRNGQLKQLPALHLRPLSRWSTCGLTSELEWEASSWGRFRA